MRCAAWPSNWGGPVPEYLWTNTTRNIRRALSARSGYSVQRVTGFSLPDKDHLAARGPQQHGATYVDTFFRPRRCALYIMIEGCDGEDFQDRHRALVLALNPLDDGELRIIAEDQTRYTLTCRVVTAVALRRYNANIGEALVQLVADDPFFYTAEEVTQFTSAIFPGLQIPFYIPAFISSTENVASFVIDNGGHVLAYPVITINGPCTNPQLINATADEVLTVAETIGAGESLMVDMGERTVILTTGGGGETNVLGSVSGVWWALQRGITLVRITSEDAAIFNGTLTFSERFLAVV